MITTVNLKEINVVKSVQGLISLYLNTDQRWQSRERILTNLQDLLKKVSGQLAAADRQKIIKLVEAGLKQKIVSLVYFIDLAGDFWREYKFKKPVRNGIYLEKNLHLTQLQELLDEYERYGVVVLDKEQARIFTVFLGEIEEIKGVFNEFPGQHKQGGSSQKRFQGHLNDHLRRHLKEVAKQVESLARKNDYTRLIIAGSKQVLPNFKAVLPKDLQPKLAGQFFTELFKSDEHFLQESLLIEEQIEREQESKIVDKLADNLGEGNRAVSGIRDVTQAVNDQKVDQLVISEGYTQSGYCCLTDNLLCLEGNCHCGGELEKVDDLVDELVQKTIAQGAKVEFVRDNNKLRDLGDIGAWLRY